MGGSGSTQSGGAGNAQSGGAGNTQGGQDQFAQLAQALTQIIDMLSQLLNTNSMQSSGSMMAGMNNGSAANNSDGGSMVGHGYSD
jgi:hypothetical protein